MSFLFDWLIQLFVFFAIVTSIASFFSKVVKSGKTSATRTDPSKMEVPIPRAEKVKRNEQKPVKKNNRPVREERYTRTPRVRDTISQKNKQLIKDVVTIEDPYRTKEKKISTTFSKKTFKTSDCLQRNIR